MHALRITLRRLARAPGFTAVVVVTLALGIGVTTAVFSVAHTVVLAPLPFAAPDRLVRVYNHPQGNLETSFEASYPDYRTWSEASRSFDGMAGFASSSGGHLVGFGDGARERVRGEMVSWNLFSVLGASPLVGRPLTAEDDVPGAEPVLVISERLWRHRLGADREVVGRVLEVDGVRRTVVAVMPDDFEYPTGARLWLPVATAVGEDLLENAHLKFFNLLARLDDGVSLAGAQEELNAVLEATTNPGLPPSARTEVTLAPLADELLGDTRGPLLFLLGAAVLVLALATANIANLQLVRAVAGRQELAVREALGASLGDRVRRSLGESAVLALLGGLLGLGVALLGVWRLLALSPATFFRGESVGLHPPVLLFALAATAGSLLVFALVPALLAARGSLGAALQGAAARTTVGRGSRGLLAASVVAQVALALVLTFGAGVLVRSFVALARVDTGFSRQGVLTQAVPLLSEEYEDPVRARQLYDELTERVAALPGVEAAAGVLLRPLEGPNGFDVPFTVEGRPAEEQAAQPLLNLEAVTPDYFRVMSIPVIAGRAFERADQADSALVVLVSRTLAETYWPGENPVGRRLKLGGPESQSPWLEVAGVVGDARYRGMEQVRLDAYVPHNQFSWALNHLVVRTEGDPLAVAGAVREVIRGLDPDLQPVDVATTAEMVSRAVARPRFNAVLLGVFAALALVLGAVGLYGVLSYVVALRRREIGIRMALGARPGQAAGLALGQALRLAAAGIAVGVAACLVLGRALGGLLAGVLYEVQAADPVSLLAVPWVLLAVALAAAAVPARRASRVDPGVVLRQE